MYNNGRVWKCSWMLVTATLLYLTWGTAPAHAMPSAFEGAGCAIPDLTAPTSEAIKLEGGEVSATDDSADDTPEESADDTTDDTWDVNHPPGSPQTVSIDTSRGTWMSVDVSPDGTRVVFDLLGDLYSLPIDGGEARPLTSGMAWDMQPSFSPDGSRIAFTSDRGGGDNIWLMAADGSDPRPLTHEQFRLLNSPTWTPDGIYVAARKHFTGRRSLGAGEIWLYHTKGGSGVQLTEKKGDQKDLGEPAFSPDGRFLYYSQDVTPGKSFQYNKNPHAGIYAIQRLELETGELETLLQGPGGAIRPTPSPDGKQLAFIRRVRFETVLFLKDLQSGAERPIFRRLDRDMQETWAIHGVYAAFDWLPDSSGLVIWAAGQLWRVPASGGSAQPIPFHVKDTRELRPALRFRVDPAPETFQVHMTRWPQVSPDGKTIVFQALGKLYIQALPGGTPRRLTRQEDHLELHPSFSRDGRWIVFATWDDEALGSVRRISARGGREKVLSPSPGHYVEPELSPDGKMVVYRRVAGGGVTSPEGGMNLGVFIKPVGRGEEFRLTRSGFQTHFGNTSSTLFFSDRREKGGTSLWHIDAHGDHKRALLDGDMVTAFRVSPDGQWVAFREGFNAYIAPLVLRGKPLKIGAQDKSLPIIKVSGDSGDNLRWSTDSTRLHWSQASQVFVQTLDTVFARVRDEKDATLPSDPSDQATPSPDTPPEPPTLLADIGFLQPSDHPSGLIAFIGGRIIPMTGQGGLDIIEDGVVVIRNNRIEAVGARGSIQVPEDAQVFNVPGTTLIPGLIDVHAHSGQAGGPDLPEQNWMNLASLAFGVTTRHNPSHGTDTFFAAAELARAGKTIAPRLFSTGTILYGARTPFMADINSAKDARSHLLRLKAAGAFSVKSYNQPRRDQRQQVIAEARKLELMVVPEGGSLFQHNMTMIVDGHTGVEHAIPVASVYDDVLQLWGGSEVGYTPTLVVGYGGLSGENYWYQHTQIWKHPRLATFTPLELLDARAIRRTMAPDEDYNHFAIARTAEALRQAGVRINVGGHGQRIGLDAHWEMWMLVQGGMPALEALRAGTINGAHYLGMDGDLGSLEPGKLADLLIIEGNPLANIRNTEHIRYTVLNGRVYEAATMDQLAPTPVTRPKLFWEMSKQHRSHGR